jgi:hypothetical protein
LASRPDYVSATSAAAMGNPDVPLDFSAHRRLKGTGRVCDDHRTRFLAHSCLAVLPSGETLGHAHQPIRARPPKGSIGSLDQPHSSRRVRPAGRRMGKGYSAIQSLVNVYLLAVVTYFGRPFEWKDEIRSEPASPASATSFSPNSPVPTAPWNGQTHDALSRAQAAFIFLGCAGVDRNGHER